MKQYKRTTITAALPYANGGVHIGHMAGVYVPADIYARYLRMRGQDVMFVGGSDEHGVPITIRARKEGITPQDVVDRYHALIKESFAEFGISFDVYSRTTSATHHEFAAAFFRKLYDEGKLVERTTKQFYDQTTGQFKTDRDIVGECPYCHNPEANGDQCEKCGRDLDPTELINPRSKESGAQLVLKDTNNWFLPLNEYSAWLKEWILEGHKEWRTNVYGQCKSWLDMDLQPRAMTRDLDWGIPVPVEGAEGKVLYVWFDAPIGYISNTKELCESNPGRWGTWQQWWQDEDTRLVHFIGKDNIVFHCIIFPVMLKAHGGYILPDNVPANEFLNLEGDKISTSRNWAVWLHEYLRDFPGKQDVLRYALTASAPETKDNDFTWADFQARNNNELVAVYGNFVNRALQLTQKYYEGRVPQPEALNDYDRQTLAEFADVKARMETLLDSFKLREAQKEAMNLARIGNKYLADSEPWKLIKTDPDRVRTVINLSLQLTANLCIAFAPFLPNSSERLAGMLAASMQTRPEEKVEASVVLAWNRLGSTDLLPVGHQLPQPSLLFEKIDDAAIQAQTDRLARIKQENIAAAFRPAEVKAPVGYDDFERLDIRVGTVLECQRVKKSNKLLQFIIDDGMERRTILSGIAAYYEPQQLVGRQVCFIANFPPRKMMGIESQGMILSAVDYDGTLRVVTPEQAVRPGCQVG